MIDRHQIEQQAHELRRQEISRFAHEFSMWVGTKLQTRHEAELREPVCDAVLRPVNPMPA